MITYFWIIYGVDKKKCFHFPGEVEERNQNEKKKLQSKLNHIIEIVYIHIFVSIVIITL